LYSVADECSSVAVVEFQRDADLNFALGGEQQVAGAIWQIQVVCRFMKILLRGF
jgi:hypothetical protein